MTMKAKCGGQEVEIPDDTAAEMEEALISLKIAQEELYESEVELSNQKNRKKWHELSIIEKFKAMFGWDPNGGVFENGHRQYVCRDCQRTDCSCNGNEGPKQSG